MATMTTTEDINFVVAQLKHMKERRKLLDKEEEKLKQKLYNLVNEHDEIVTEDGEVIFTWKYTADTKYLDAKKFEADHPELYNEYMAFRAGHRRLELK
jgi:hypothetical protein